jgi:hypothetical protein
VESYLHSPYAFVARSLAFPLARLLVQNVCSVSAGVGRTRAGRGKTKEWRETKLLRGACVQTAFHAEQTKLWPLFDFPSEFIRTAAGGGNVMATGARMGELRNTYRIYSENLKGGGTAVHVAYLIVQCTMK